MIRMSDIIKMGGIGKPGLTEPKSTEIVKESGRLTACQLHNCGVALIKEIIDNVRTGKAVERQPIIDFINQLVENVWIDEYEQFSYFYNAPPQDTYLYNHSINVALLAAKLCSWAELNKSELVELATAGFLHDIGMVKVESITRKKGQLEKAERVEMGRHPEYSETILREIDGLTEKTMSAVRFHHHKGSRDKFAQVLSLADIFEAMTHPRAYRKQKLPHEAITEIITKEAEYFQPELLRALINHVGIYPIGSWVKLNTGDSGVVLEINKDYPLRPKIRIVFNYKGDRLSDAKISDLAAESHLYIDGPIDIAGHEVPKTGLT